MPPSSIPAHHLKFKNSSDDQDKRTSFNSFDREHIQQRLTTVQNQIKWLQKIQETLMLQLKSRKFE